MSYVPPHKRGQAPIELKDFPSLAGGGGGRAGGAGTGEKYSSKVAVPVTISKLNIEKKEPTTFIGSRFQKTTTEYKIVPEIYKSIEIPTKDDGWTTVESKPIKKLPPKEDEWAGFDY